MLLVQIVVSVHCMCCFHGHLNICPCYRSVTATACCNMAAVPVSPSIRLCFALHFKRAAINTFRKLSVNICGCGSNDGNVYMQVKKLE
jgi:hypothetical protein